MRLHQILNEKTFKFDSFYGTPITVHENPSVSGLMGLVNKSQYKAARGLILYDVVLWWDASEAIHTEIATEYMGERDVGLRLTLRKVHGTYILEIERDNTERVLNNKRIKHLLARNDVKVEETNSVLTPDDDDMFDGFDSDMDFIRMDDY